ncbi:MAG: hypothetical protein HYT12_03835 [Candidatus Liptonbacteria bacterium]|nr:hypothetical protein [Candidatus Liptonbacteria bacterium]
MQQLIDFLQSIFVDKAPALPEGLKSFIVKVAPYAVVVALIFIGMTMFTLIPALFAAIGIGVAAGITEAFFSPMMLVYILLGIVNIALLIMAIPGLFKKTESGWKYVFYVSLVALVSNIISVSIFSVIMSVLGLYFLFQVRSYYMGSLYSSPFSPPVPPIRPPM